MNALEAAATQVATAGSLAFPLERQALAQRVVEAWLDARLEEMSDYQRGELDDNLIIAGSTDCSPDQWRESWNATIREALLGREWVGEP